MEGPFNARKLSLKKPGGAPLIDHAAIQLFELEF